MANRNRPVNANPRKKIECRDTCLPYPLLGKASPCAEATVHPSPLRAAPASGAVMP